jgi:hypothetical protein
MSQRHQQVAATKTAIRKLASSAASPRSAHARASSAAISFGHVVRLALGSVESEDDADWRGILALEQAADHCSAVRVRRTRLGPGPAVLAAEIVELR